MIIENFLEWINPTLWIISNLELIYIGIVLITFVILYVIWFDPKATTGGKMIFRFAYSLSLFVAVIFVGIFVGIFIDPRHDIPWYAYPGDTLLWRPIIRLGAYSYVSFTISTLVLFLWKRKFRPEKLKTAPDKLLVKPRHDTAEIPIAKEKLNG